MRNREFDDVLDELKMLHDAKNHDYATEDNPYANLERVASIGVEPWRGVVIRLCDKFMRVEQFCRSGELAVKSESLEDTLMDIANYSILALILYRREQELDNPFMEEWKKRPKSTKQVDKALEWNEIERNRKRNEEKTGSFFTPVDDKLQSDMTSDHPIIAMRRSAEEAQNN